MSERENDDELSGLAGLAEGQEIELQPADEEPGPGDFRPRAVRENEPGSMGGDNGGG